MAADRELWRNQGTGEVLSIPAGGGEHLRSLGWLPADAKPTVPAAQEASEGPSEAKPVKSTAMKKRATSRKTLA